MDFALCSESPAKLDQSGISNISLDITTSDVGDSPQKDQDSSAELAHGDVHDVPSRANIASSEDIKDHMNGATSFKPDTNQSVVENVDPVVRKSELQTEQSDSSTGASVDAEVSSLQEQQSYIKGTHYSTLSLMLVCIRQSA